MENVLEVVTSLSINIIENIKNLFVEKDIIIDNEDKLNNVIKSEDEDIVEDGEIHSNNDSQR
jgi:hypothetical protein